VHECGNVDIMWMAVMEIEGIRVIAECSPLDNQITRTFDIRQEDFFLLTGSCRAGVEDE